MGAMTIALMAGQTLAFVGAVVGGSLARGRRFEMEAMNTKLRTINGELRRLKDDAEEELALRVQLASREALEATLNAPSAPHPVEKVGDGSMAEARRELLASLQEGRTYLRIENFDMAILRLERAQVLAEELRDKPGMVSAVRGQAQAHRALEDLGTALRCLQTVLGLIEGDGGARLADVYGELGDVYADIGDLEKAGEYYDLCISTTTSYDDE